MGVEIKWLARWFAKLMGKLHAGAGGRHHSTGEGAIHIGQLAGPVTNVHLTQHIYARSLPAPLAATPQPCTPPPPPPPPAQRPAVTPEQRDVLFLMQKLPDRIAVLDFMQREFDTRMVIELQPVQVYRLRRYVEVVLQKGK